MRFTIALASVAAFIGGAVAQTINTPSNLVQCQPSLISWTGVTGSVQLFITAGDNPSGPAINDLGQQTGSSFTYRVEEPGGTSLVFNIRTSTGAIFQTGIVTVTTGGNDDCLTSASGSGSSASGSSTEESSTGATTTTAATSAPATTTATSATTRATTTARTTTGTSASGSSAGASTTSSDNSAPTQYAGAGVVGAVGIAVMALLA